MWSRIIRVHIAMLGKPLGYGGIVAPKEIIICSYRQILVDVVEYQLSLPFLDKCTTSLVRLKEKIRK